MNVSVIIINFNRKEILEGVLDSLFKQTNGGDEVVIVDDGSTDGTEEMVRRKIPSITYLKVPANEGNKISTRINQGLKVAKNDMIWCLDSDCIPYENCLQLLKDNFRKDRIIAGAIMYEDENGEIEGPDHPYRLNYMEEMSLLDPEMYNHWAETCEVFDPILCFGGNICFSKEQALQTGGFDPDFDGAWGAEDAWFADKMMFKLSTKLLYAPGAAVIHQYNPDSEGYQERNLHERNKGLWTRKSIEMRRFTKENTDEKKYDIEGPYQAGNRYHHYDDTENEEEWQLEVYLHAKEIMEAHNFKSVIDIGCGSAYKLLKYLGDYETIGIEVPKTYEWLCENIPDRRWQLSDFKSNQKLSCDLVICSDVIEHLIDPDELMGFIERISFRYLVLSTPDRGLLHEPWEKEFWGPPINLAHQREWTFDEFYKYVSKHFDIVEHKVTNSAQATQMIVCVREKKKE